MANLNQLNEALNRYVRPQTPPVAVRMVTSQDELPERVRFPKRDMGLLMPLCQGISLARRYGFVVAMGVEDMNCAISPVVLGFLPPKKRFLDGDFPVPPMPLGEARARFRQNLKLLEYGKYNYVVIAPIHRTTFEPHFVAIYINPAQMSRLAQGTAFMSGKMPHASVWPVGTCAPVFAHTILEDDYQAIVPGAGERNAALVQDNEVTFTIPASKIDELIQGLAESEKTGIFRYPFPSWLRFQVQMPEGHADLKEYLSREGE